MMYSLIAILTLGAIHAAARPQDAPAGPTVPGAASGHAPAQASPKASGSGKSSCSLKEVIIARGTSEAGTYGFRSNVEKKLIMSVVGDPLVSELRRQMPEIKAYAVRYPADTNQGPGTEQGANDVVKHVTSQIAACPNAKFALVGYSQGARVVRIGATRLDPAAQDRIVAAVVYGDSGDKRGTVKFPPKVLAKLKNNCYPGDPNCNESGSFANHMMYNTGTYHRDSAAFIIAGFKGEPLPLTSSPPRVVSGDTTSSCGKGKSGKGDQGPPAQ